MHMIKEPPAHDPRCTGSAAVVHLIGIGRTPLECQQQHSQLREVGRSHSYVVAAAQV